MKKKYTYIIYIGILSVMLPCLTKVKLHAQESLWQSIPALGYIDAVADGGDELFFVSQESLFVSPRDKVGEVRPLGRKEGLTDYRVRDIIYNTHLHTLAVYYASGTVDLISPTGVVSITAIANNLQLRDKSIFRLLAYEDKLYLAGAFGLSKVDMRNGQIEATYQLQQVVKDVTRVGNKLLIITSNGEVEEGDESTNLQDPSQWHKVEIAGAEGEQFAEVAHYKEGVLLLGKESRKLYYYDLKGGKATQLREHVDKLYPDNWGVAAVSGVNMTYYPNDGDAQEFTIGGPNIRGLSHNSNKELFYLSKGPSIVTLTSSNKEFRFTQPLYNGPSDNHFFYSTCAQGYYYAVGGGRGVDRYSRAGSIKIRNREAQWRNIDADSLPEGERMGFRDIVSIAVDPTDANHIFAGSWGEGLYEFRGKELVKHYSLDNSPLVSALPNDKYAALFVRVGSLTSDPKGGVWMALGGTSNNIYYLSAQGEWSRYGNLDVDGVNAFGKALLLSDGTYCTHIYHRGLSGSKGILFYNNAGTPSQTSDDKSFYVPQLHERTGKIIEITTIYDMALDKKGALWLGTNKGPIIIPNPNNVLRQMKSPLATRPIGGKEPNLFYILDNVPINAIAVDGINNKWVGTQDDGIYLLNEDGSQILEHYTRFNSPLVSNNIMTLAIDEESGLLYIGSDGGLNTLDIGSRTFNKSMEKAIHAYPNPLRPEDPDWVTITGLTAGMDIKIVNAAGALVHSGTSSGASYGFNARTASGDRYAAGVYTVLLYDPRSKLSTQIRIAVVQ